MDSLLGHDVRYFTVTTSTTEVYPHGGLRAKILAQQKQERHGKRCVNVALKSSFSSCT